MHTKTTCTKVFPEFPFAHRQHNHDGHCAFIHGHNWSFSLTFAADRLDENDFVVDFGKLKWIREWLTEQFDHTLVLNEDDPHLAYLEDHLTPCLANTTGSCFAKIVRVPNCGAEGLAKWVLEMLNEAFIANPQYRARRVRIQSVTVLEDSKNSATVEAL